MRQILLGHSALVQDRQVGVSRAGDGFVLTTATTTGTASSLSFAYASGVGVLGAVTTIESSAPSGYGFGVAGKASPGDQLLLFTFGGGVFPAMQVSTSVLDAGGTTFGPAQTLFSTNLINQNGQAAVGTSFDGLHSLVAAGSSVVGQPVAGVVGADGRLVGQALTIATTAADMLWDHLLVTPTAHGGAVSVTDNLDGVPRWRIVEFDGTGAVALDASLPLPNGFATYVAPHLVAPSPRGFAAIVAIANNGPMKLVEVDRTGSASAGPAITRVNDVSPDDNVVALGALGTNFLLAFASTDITVLRLGRVQSDGTVHAVNVPLPDAQSFPNWIRTEGDGLAFAYHTTDSLAIVKVNCPL